MSQENYLDLENDFFASRLKEPFSNYYDMITSILLGEYDTEDDVDEMYNVSSILCFVDEKKRLPNNYKIYIQDRFERFKNK